MGANLEAWANADWSFGIPVLKTLPEDIQQKWGILSIDEKITLVLSQFENKPIEASSARDTALKKCWQKSEECASGKKILAVREKCLEASPILKVEQSNMLQLHCDDGVIEIPHFYKPALAKDSGFFKGLFYGAFKESAANNFKIENSSKAEIERVIQIWAGHPLQDFDEACNLLETSNTLDLQLPAITDALVAAIHTWHDDDVETVQMALTLANQVSNYSVTAEIQQTLGAFLATAYLHAERRDKKELVEDILSTLNKLQVNILDLNYQNINDRELRKIISSCPKLISLSLHNSAISDQSFVYLAELTQMTNLSLDGCKKLTDNGLKELANLTNLTSLSLNMCNQLSDAGLKELANLTKLKSLDLGWCHGLTDDGLIELTKLRHLTDLNLMQCTHITDTSLKELANLTQLTDLKLAGCDLLTDAGLKELTKLTQLISLDLRVCKQLTDTGLIELAKLKLLRNIDLSGCRFTSAFIKELAPMTELRNLSLCECRLTDAALIELANLTQLTTLDMSGTRLTDNGLIKLANLTRLKNLNLTGCGQISDFGLKKALPNLTSLTSLNLRACYMLTDEGLKELAHLTNLTSLNISMSQKLTDVGIIAVLANLKNLTSLRISGFYQQKELTDLFPNLDIEFLQ